jgi:hypothetical protein
VVPVAPTLKFAVPPLVTVWFDGCDVIVGGICAATHAENSEVLFVLSVAVAVTAAPIGTLAENVKLKFALPAVVVVTFCAPMKFMPSPNPDESHCELKKNSSR